MFLGWEIKEKTRTMSDQQILNLKRMFALSRTPTIINVDKNGVHVQKNWLKMSRNTCTEIDNVKASSTMTHMNVLFPTMEI